MIGIGRCLACLLIAAGMMISGVCSAQADTEVDLALVLAVDVSLSMEPDEQDLQRQGFIEAFRSPEVHDAIRKGMLGRIADAQSRTIRGPDPRGCFVGEGDLLNDETDGVQLALPSVRAGSAIQLTSEPSDRWKGKVR
jgi:Protein of unknown function (DUF1194)